MSSNNFVKLTLTETEMTDLKEAVESGLGRNKADVCRKALVEYLKENATDPGVVEA